MAYLRQHLDFVRTTEEFFGDDPVSLPPDYISGIWVSGENGDTYRRKRIFNYYQESPLYTGGVLKSFSEELAKHGWYCEWHDPGTVLIYPF
jgi:hypothetical protein